MSNPTKNDAMTRIILAVEYIYIYILEFPKRSPAQLNSKMSHNAKTCSYYLIFNFQSVTNCPAEQKFNELLIRIRAWTHPSNGLSSSKLVMLSSCLSSCFIITIIRSITRLHYEETRIEEKGNYIHCMIEVKVELLLLLSPLSSFILLCLILVLLSWSRSLIESSFMEAT